MQKLHNEVSMQIIVLGIASLVAFGISAVCGGGAGLMLLPLLGLTLSSAQVPAALSIGTFVSSASRLIVFIRHIRWSLVVWFVPPALPAVWLGARMLSSINPLYVQLFMSLFLVANLPLLFQRNPKHPSKPLPHFALAIIGAAAGFVSGLTGAVGLLFNRSYLRYGLTKQEIVATRAANEIILHIIKATLYASFGLLTTQVLRIGLVIALGAILSSISMKKVLPYLSEQRFRQIGYIAMVGSGLYMFIETSSVLVRQKDITINYQLLTSGAEAKFQWQNQLLSIEFEYDEGFEFEHQISMSELPKPLQEKVSTWSKNKDRVIVEEVFGWQKHYYEVYLFKGTALTKIDLPI